MSLGASDGRAAIAATTAAMIVVAFAGAVRAEPACGTAGGEPVWVERVVRGDEMVLVDGRRLRFATAEAPRPGLAAGEAVRREAEAAGRAAREALADLVEGRELAFTEAGLDRHGRRLGHLYDIDGGQWIEARLVAAGHLRVFPTREVRDCAAALLVAEGEARAARRGIWATASFAVVPARAADLAGRLGERLVVEGRVTSVGRSSGRVWLNFGDDFRRDFAVVMDDKDLDRFRAAGFDAPAARGRLLRVRGVLVHRGGPRMVLDVPEDVEHVTR